MVTGVGMPAFAAGTVRQPAAGAVAHVHADGSVHRHAVLTAHEHDGAAGGGVAKQLTHCPGCMMEADCALSCLGMAVLPAATGWSPSAIATAWAVPASATPMGVVPPGETDPPRPVPVR